MIGSQLVKKLMQMVRLPFHSFAVLRTGQQMSWRMNHKRYISLLKLKQTQTVDYNVNARYWLPARLRKNTYPKQVTIQEPN